MMRKKRWEGYGDGWPEGQRPCTSCEEMKPFSEYHKHSGCLFGVNTVCKKCRIEMSKKQWVRNKGMQRRPREGWDLYLAECRGYYKVGIAKDPDARLKDLQTGNPYPITLIKTWPGRSDLEKEVHDMLEQFHHRGEWFEGACEL